MQFSLYIHWPFCLKKCPYCDFNSYAWKHESEEWVAALIKEITLYQHIFKGYKIKTIFFGGGTPSLIPPVLIKKILEKVFEAWQITEVIEISLEVNPSSIECHSLESFLQYGINRFSIGVQSLNDDDLKFLGRLHSAAEAVKIVEHASKICDNVSADFIYTLPYDSLSKWKKQLANIIELAEKTNLKHLSLYQLTIEENTQFAHDVKIEKWKPMKQDTQSILYRYTHKTFDKMKWNQYEISNVSRSKEYECKHNLSYWKYSEYLGIGPGAHSRMTLENEKYSFNNYKTPLKWKKQVEEESTAKLSELKFLEQCTNLSEKDQFIERMLMGLRLKEGIVLKKEELCFIKQKDLQLLKEKHFLKTKNDALSLSLKGRLRLNAILKMLIQ